MLEKQRHRKVRTYSEITHGDLLPGLKFLPLYQSHSQSDFQLQSLSDVTARSEWTIISGKLSISAANSVP